MVDKEDNKKEDKDDGTDQIRYMKVKIGTKRRVAVKMLQRRMMWRD